MKTWVQAKWNLAFKRPWTKHHRKWWMVKWQEKIQMSNPFKLFLKAHQGRWIQFTCNDSRWMLIRTTITMMPGLKYCRGNLRAKALETVSLWSPWDNSHQLAWCSNVWEDHLSTEAILWCRISFWISKQTWWLLTPTTKLRLCQDTKLRGTPLMNLVEQVQ